MASETTYTCDICLKPITDRDMYQYHGGEYDWLLGDGGFDLHQACTEVFTLAQEAAEAAGKKVFKEHRQSLTKGGG